MTVDKISLENDFDQLLMRLERNNKNVLRMAHKLNSYMYEPKDYECFIKLRDLRSGFNALAQDHIELTSVLKRLEPDESVQRVEDILKRYQELEKGIATYLLMAEKHL